MTKTNIIKQEKTRLVEFGVCMPKETVERIEAVKGPYITRGKYILKAVDKLLEEEEQTNISRPPFPVNWSSPSPLIILSFPEPSPISVSPQFLSFPSPLTITSFPEPLVSRVSPRLRSFPSPLSITDPNFKTFLCR
jgi:hypothetical protein